MAFSSSNLFCESNPIGEGPRHWVYREAVNHSVIEGVGYFANGKRLGMKIGDSLMFISGTTAATSAVTMHAVSGSTGAVAVSSTYGSSAFDQAFNCSVGAATT